MNFAKAPTRTAPRLGFDRGTTTSARQARAEVVASRQSRLDGVPNESTFYCCVAERKDRPNARVDHRASVMLARLRALREWLLRRNRRSRTALGQSFPGRARRLLVRVLHQGSSAPARPSVALR